MGCYQSYQSKDENDGDSYDVSVESEHYMIAVDKDSASPQEIAVFSNEEPTPPPLFSPGIHNPIAECGTTTTSENHDTIIIINNDDPNPAPTPPVRKKVTKFMKPIVSQVNESESNLYPTTASTTPPVRVPSTPKKKLLHIESTPEEFESSDLYDSPVAISVPYNAGNDRHSGNTAGNTGNRSPWSEASAIDSLASSFDSADSSYYSEAEDRGTSYEDEFDRYYDRENGKMSCRYSV